MRKISLSNVKNDLGTRSDSEELKPKKKFNIKALLLVLLFVVLVAAAIFAASRWQRQLTNSVSSSGQNTADACVEILNPACWTQAFKPQLDKVDGKTNVLIVGVDTRESGSGAGLANTDTIILATINHDTGQTRMISFPRDLYAPYQYTDNGPTYRTKINAIYASGRSQTADKDGMKVLKRTIERMTGEKIQYTGLIRLEGVVQLIDAIGGITVQIPEDHTDVYPFIELSQKYKDTCKRWSGDRNYCLFTFKTGPTPMDGETALIYARMRKLSSDFDRGRRQQEIISAAKDKVLGDDTPIAQKAQNLFSVYTNLAKHVEVNITLEMILAGLDLVNDVDRDPSRIVVDPSFGGGGVVIKGDGSNFNFKDYSFKQLQDKLKFINANDDLYRDEPKILGTNYTGEKWANENPLIKIKSGGYWFTEIVTETKPKSKDKFGIEIIDYTAGKKKNTVERLKKEYGEAADITVITADETNGLKRTDKYKEDIAINIYPTKPVVTETPTTAAPTTN